MISISFARPQDRYIFARHRHASSVVKSLGAKVIKMRGDLTLLWRVSNAALCSLELGEFQMGGQKYCGKKFDAGRKDASTALAVSCSFHTRRRMGGGEVQYMHM